MKRDGEKGSGCERRLRKSSLKKRKRRRKSQGRKREDKIVGSNLRQSSNNLPYRYRRSSTLRLAWKEYTTNNTWTYDSTPQGSIKLLCESPCDVPFTYPLSFTSSTSKLISDDRNINSKMAATMRPGLMKPINETEHSFSRVTREGKTITYNLKVIQQPERARACGAGAKCKIICTPKPLNPITNNQNHSVR